MSEIVIRPFETRDLIELREIFFESSTRKNFKDESEKEAFFWKYAGYYLQNFSEFVIVAHRHRVLGYVLGMPESDDESLFAIQPHMKAFQVYFRDFPAHLHINCHIESRGLGVGRLLVQEFENKLVPLNSKGLHILTGVDSRNKSFYQKLGFSIEKVESYQGNPILFMGKNLLS